MPRKTNPTVPESKWPHCPHRHLHRAFFSLLLRPSMHITIPFHSHAQSFSYGLDKVKPPVVRQAQGTAQNERREHKRTCSKAAVQVEARTEVSANERSPRGPRELSSETINMNRFLPGYRLWGTVSFGSCLRFDLAWVEMKLTHGSKPSQGRVVGPATMWRAQGAGKGHDQLKPVWLDGEQRRAKAWSKWRMPAFWRKECKEAPEQGGWKGLQGVGSWGQVQESEKRVCLSELRNYQPNRSYLTTFPFLDWERS